MQSGNSSWDYDVEHDILTIFLFEDGRPILEQVHGYLNRNTVIETLHNEDRFTFREALRKRIAVPDGKPIQVRLKTSSGPFVPVLFSWHYMQHHIGGGK